MPAISHRSGSSAGIVLVADSDPAVAEAIARELRERHYDVVIATNGVDAIAELHDAELDVVIVDLDIPPRGGHEVRRIATELSPDVEVIFGTANPARGEVDETRGPTSSRSFETLQKPYDLDQLARSVARAVEHRRLHTMTTLYRACSAIGGSTRPERLPGVLVELSRESLEAEGVLLLLPSSNGRIHVGYAAGAAPRENAADHIAVVELVLDHTSSARRRGTAAMILPDDIAATSTSTSTSTGASASSDALAARVQQARMRSAIVYPLMSGDRLAGVVLAWRTADSRPFRRSDVDRTAVLAAPILLALENARLLAKMLASERLAAVGAVAAGVVHEINNPLTYVVASHSYALEQLSALRDVVAATTAAAPAQLQRLDAIADEIRGAIDDAEVGAQRIVEISRDLKTMSRCAPDDSEIADVSNAARSALHMTAARIRLSANVILNLNDGARVRGSQGRLSQVFINLIVNAAEAADGVGSSSCASGPRGQQQLAYRAPKPKSPIDLFVSTSREGDRIVATVRDTGPGIHPKDLPRLFDTFFTTKQLGEGTGLGLAVTRQIVEEMGGEIAVRSELGVGTTFTATFPSAESASKVPRLPRARGDVDERRMRLLFIDDEFPVLRCYERWFGRDHDVQTVQSSERAMELIHQQPNLTAIICDVVMPNTTGPEVFAQVRAAYPELAHRFIFVTGSLAESSVRVQLAKLPCAVLEKPIDIRALRETLRAMHEREQLSAVA